MCHVCFSTLQLQQSFFLLEGAWMRKTVCAALPLLSLVEDTTIGLFFDHHDITFPFDWKIYPDIYLDFRSLLSLAKSESAYPARPSSFRESCPFDPWLHGVTNIDECQFSSAFEILPHPLCRSQMLQIRLGCVLR